MKNQQNKCLTALQLLLDITHLREDTFLFYKITLFSNNQTLRNQHHQQLHRLQQQRALLQQQIIALFQPLDITPFWKSHLIQFSNKIYKSIKNYHQKLMGCSLKLSEMADTNEFLQAFRVLAIDKLSSTQQLAVFLAQIIAHIRQRYRREVVPIASNSHFNKIMDTIRHEQASKNNKYLSLIREDNPALFFHYHHQVLQEYSQHIYNILTNTNSHKLTAFSLFADILDLEYHQATYLISSSLPIHLNYKQQGFCQFILSRYHRIIKDFKNKNALNQQQIIAFIQKFKNWKDKSKQLFAKSKCHILCPKKAARTHKPTAGHHNTEAKEQLGIVSTLQFQNTTFTQNILHETHLNTTQFSNELPSNKKHNLFKIQRTENRKRVSTVKPLGEWKQNNKEVIHQKIMEMKLQEDGCELGKLVRIKRKRVLLGVHEQNGLGHLIKQNKLSRLSFLLH